jgi:hypothetical protein
VQVRDAARRKEEQERDGQPACEQESHCKYQDAQLTMLALFKINS